MQRSIRGGLNWVQRWGKCPVGRGISPVMPIARASRRAARPAANSHFSGFPLECRVADEVGTRLANSGSSSHRQHDRGHSVQRGGGDVELHEFGRHGAG